MQLFIHLYKSICTGVLLYFIFHFLSFFKILTLLMNFISEKKALLTMGNAKLKTVLTGPISVFCWSYKNSGIPNMAKNCGIPKTLQLRRKFEENVIH